LTSNWNLEGRKLRSCGSYNRLPHS
jgi:hypothetical protein